MLTVILGIVFTICLFGSGMCLLVLVYKNHANSHEDANLAIMLVGLLLLFVGVLAGIGTAATAEKMDGLSGPNIEVEKE